MTKRTQFLRKKVLQEWRGLPEEKTKDRSLGIPELLEKVVKKLGLQSRIKEAEIMAAWRDLVGDFLAAHSQPQQLQRHVLYVRVLQPTIRYELDRVWKKEVIGKLQERFGVNVIRDIKFCL
jgi:predicted nucleic acid-binding Zn ribbon protein